LNLAVSLAVRTFVIDMSGKRTHLPEPPDASELAGFENWRTEVWGSAAVRALGATIFPQLAVRDLQVMPGRQLNEFRRECRLLRAHLDEIVAAVDLTSQQGVVVTTTGVIRPGESREALRAALSQRLANIEAAIRRAKKVRGGVSIE
jgi:hypothetical protein